MFQQRAVVPIDYASVAHEGGTLHLSPTTLPFLLQKGSCWVLKGEFACAVTCSFGKLRVFYHLLKRGGYLCVGLFWITLKPVFYQWYLCGIFNAPASFREVVGSGSSRGLTLAFLSSAFYQSRNDCDTALAPEPCQMLQAQSMLNGEPSCLPFLLSSIYRVLKRPFGVEVGGKGGVRCYHLLCTPWEYPHGWIINLQPEIGGLGCRVPKSGQKAPQAPLPSLGTCLPTRAAKWRSASYLWSLELGAFKMHFWTHYWISDRNKSLSN